MINSRLSLHAIFEDILGSKNVYFQPPGSIKMQYPCIVYSLSEIPIKHANNGVYISNYCYDVTLIDPDPDNEFVDKLKELKYSRFKRHFSTQGLNHYVFTLKYKNETKENK